MNELKRCAHCGGEAVAETSISGQGWHVKCPGCRISTGWRKTKAEAIADWNRRADRWVSGFDITNADGSEIDYDKICDENPSLLRFDIDQFYIGEDGALVLMDDCGHSEYDDRTKYRITPHLLPKPPEDTDA
jgi:Lar family restriction alleviation protein